MNETNYFANKAETLRKNHDKKKLKRAFLVIPVDPLIEDRRPRVERLGERYSAQIIHVE